MSNPRIKKAAAAYLRFMEVAGIPLNDETVDTPQRVAKMFVEEFSSHAIEPPTITTFDARDYDQYVVVADMQFSSLCEHHHLPFFGVMHVGYLPNKRVIGLSKIPRVLRHFASRPQLQERLVAEVAQYLFDVLRPHCLMAVSQASHSCMQCRGIRDPRSRTVTSKIIETDGNEVDKIEMLSLMGMAR